jgi:hypothetical protein
MPPGPVRIDVRPRPRERNGSLPLTSTAVMLDDRSSTPTVDGELNGSS